MFTLLQYFKELISTKVMGKFDTEVYPTFYVIDNVPYILQVLHVDIYNWEKTK